MRAKALTARRDRGIYTIRIRTMTPAGTAKVDIMTYANRADWRRAYRTTLGAAKQRRTGQ